MCSYAAGQSEVVMGQAIKKYAWNRNDIVISTKLNWGEFTSHPQTSMPLTMLTRQAVQMAKFLSTTTACHENTSSKVSAHH
jgi:aryl-alcohol dehydrogenase-like predicted oxidoreductase